MFSIEDYEEDFEVWPCNWRAAVFMSRMGRGAWKYAMDGPAALDYDVILNILFDQHGIKRKHRKRLFSDLQLIEGHAVAAMRETP